MKYKGILFDLDGVILPSDRLHYLAWKKVAAQENIFLYDLAFADTLGISKKEALEKILEHAKINKSEVEKKKLIEMKDYYYEKYASSINEDFVSIKVLNLINNLKEKGIKLAIASSSKHARYLLKKTKIIDKFDVIVDGNDIKNGKPDPEVFVLARDRLKLKTSECIVVEDSLVGIEAAHNGGFDSIGISEATKSQFVTYKVKSIDEIINIIYSENK